MGLWLVMQGHSCAGTEADFLEQVPPTHGCAGSHSIMQVPAVLHGALVIPAFSHNTMLVDSHSHVGVVAGFS